MQWAFSVIGLIGVGLNIAGKWQGYLCWTASSAFWTYHNVTIGEYVQAMLFAMFGLISLVGVILKGRFSSSPAERE